MRSMQRLNPTMKDRKLMKTVTLVQSDLLKKEKFLKDSTWVENLCTEGKLDFAVERAEENIAAAVEAGKLEEQSYSYVYKVFKKDRG